MSASDPLFEAYVTASDAEAPTALERIVEAVQPAIRDACRGALGPGRDETEDACGDALTHVIARMRQLRDARNDGGTAIQNVAAYAAVTARRVCADQLRRAHPVRARLGCRVRYALTHDPNLRLRRTDAGVMYAGLSGWSDALPSASPAAVSRIASDLHPAVAGAALLAAVREVLDRAGGWVETRALIAALFDAAALKDPTFTPTEDLDLPAPPAPDRGDGDEWRDRLESAWCEIAQLPARQRTALLLHLRDEEGRSGLTLLRLSGIVTMAALAAALDLTPADLAVLLPTLPLDDLRISERLGISRQQVINLRKSARARLARRLADRAPGVVIHGAFPRQIVGEQS
jgi:DNA-directed RNA polymerase specialized sigma24 family protein